MSGAEGAAAEGAAFDAGVEVIESFEDRPPPEDPRPNLEAAVISARTKVDRQREHLAAAESVLARAEAELAALDGEG